MRSQRWCAAPLTIDGLTYGLSVVSGLILVGLMAILVLDVILRATVDAPFAGTIGITQVALAFLVYLALPQTQASNQNVRVEVVLAKLPGRVRSGIEIGNHLVILAVSLFLGWAAIPAAERAIELGEARRGIIDIPVWPARVALVVCAFLVALAVLRQLVWPNVREWRSQPEVPAA